MLDLLDEDSIAFVREELEQFRILARDAEFSGPRMEDDLALLFAAKIDSLLEDGVDGMSRKADDVFVAPLQGLLVPLSGTISYPREWEECLEDGRFLKTLLLKRTETRLLPFWLGIRMIALESDHMKPLGGFLTAEWDLGVVPPGEYVLTSRDPRLVIPVEVPDQGITDLRIDLPVPAVIELALHRSEDGSSIRGWPELEWRPEGSLDVSVVSMDHETGLFGFCALPGIIEVQAREQNEVVFYRKIAVEPGSNEVRLEVDAE